MENQDEQWRPVAGYEGIYSVSTAGRVRSEPRITVQSNGKALTIKGRVLRPYVMKKGYCLYDIRKDNEALNFYGHRIVLEAFVGPAPEGCEACHNNGQRGDNRLDNLRWDTRKGNFRDKSAHGTAPVGERHPQAKLSEEEVLRIRADKRPGAVVSREFGVASSHICSIRRGRHWKHLNDQKT